MASDTLLKMNGRRGDRYAAWGLTWIAYASYYLGRKGFSVVKSTLRHSLGVSERALGLIDTFYLAAYALGLFFSGYVGDRVGARRLIAGGMGLSALCCFAFGAMDAAFWFGVLFFLNGLAQSTGWPGTTRAMAEWTTPRNRGTVMAFWATCYQVGSIVASDFAAYLLRRDGWRAAFFGPAACMLVVAVLIFSFLKSGERASDSGDPMAEGPTADARRAAQGEALHNPVLWSFGASYFFIKYVRYALLFWLPYYLHGTLGYAVDHAAYVSNAFEAGGIVGVIAIGMLSDRVRRWSRAVVSISSLFCLALALLVCAALPQRDVWLTVGARSGRRATLWPGRFAVWSRRSGRRRRRRCRDRHRAGQRCRLGRRHVGRPHVARNQQPLRLANDVSAARRPRRVRRVGAASSGASPR